MITKNIRFPKGDTKPFKVRIKMADGEYFSPNDKYDDLVFEVRATPSSKAVIKKQFTAGDILFDEASKFFSFTIEAVESDGLCLEYIYWYRVKLYSKPTDTEISVVGGTLEVY